MTETVRYFKETGIYKVDHSTFGGIIYESDFCTTHGGKSKATSGSSIAQRIVADRAFDRKMRSIAEQTKRIREYKEKHGEL